MSEVLITLRNLNESHPVTVGEFRWNESVKRHLMQGRPLSIAEFNAFMQSPEWDRSIERNGERLRIEIREGIDPQVDELKARVSELEALIKSQDGQVAKSSGSYPEDAGSTPAPATTTDLLSAAKTAVLPKGRRSRENTRANSRGRQRNG